MGSYEPPKDECDFDRVKSDCQDTKEVAKNPRDFLLDGKPQYYKDRNNEKDY